MRMSLCVALRSTSPQGRVVLAFGDSRVLCPVTPRQFQSPIDSSSVKHKYSLWVVRVAVAVVLIDILQWITLSFTGPN